MHVDFFQGFSSRIIALSVVVLPDRKIVSTSTYAICFCQPILVTVDNLHYNNYTHFLQYRNCCKKHPFIFGDYDHWIFPPKCEFCARTLQSTHFYRQIVDISQICTQRVFSGITCPALCLSAHAATKAHRLTRRSGQRRRMIQPPHRL